MSVQTKFKRQSGSRHPSEIVNRQANKESASVEESIDDDNDDYEDNHNDHGLTLTMTNGPLPTAKPRSRFLSVRAMWVAAIFTMIVIQLKNTPIDLCPPSDA